MRRNRWRPMSEVEWLPSRDWVMLAGYLQHDKVPAGSRPSRVSRRNVRLLACSSVRFSWDDLVDEVCRRAVEIAELVADGLITQGEWDAAVRASREAQDELPGHPSVPHCEGPIWLSTALAHEATRVLNASLYDAFSGCVPIVRGVKRESPPNELFRDIFGNPFRRVTARSAWWTPDVLALARGAYDERTLPSGLLDPARLAVLADALEDAGCDSAELLGHLRLPGPHVRGCFAVDLILEKS